MPSENYQQPEIDFRGINEHNIRYILQMHNFLLSERAVDPSSRLLFFRGYVNNTIHQRLNIHIILLSVEQESVERTQHTAHRPEI